MNEHHERVSHIASQVRSFYERKESFRIYHGTTNITRHVHFERDKIIDTRHLTKVLRMDRLKRTALCEPNVSMMQLVYDTMKIGMIPQVVMEFPSITVGGGFAGTSGESSSFKHGFFENTINWIEIVLAGGEVVKASRTERSDLLEAAAGSFGTFGVTTLLEVQLMPAKPYTRLDFLPVNNMTKAIQKLEEATNDQGNDYVDGIVYNKDLSVIMTGHMIDKAPTHPDVSMERFTRPTNQWFYRYIEKRLDENNAPFSISLPLVDYLFRYDRGAFWGGYWAFKYFMVPLNRITQYILDPLMNAKVMYHALHESGIANQYIVQDIGFPKSTTEKFIDYLDEEFGFYPLWLCPLKKGNPTMPLRPRTGTPEGDKILSKELIINVGVWGPGSTNQLEFISENRRIEKKTRDLFGVKCLYARAYYTEEEFWDVYNRKWYEEMRVKYNATTLPSIYDKIKIDVEAIEKSMRETRMWPFSHLPNFWEIWPTAGVYGAVKSLIGLYSPFGQNYLLGK